MAHGACSFVCLLVACLLLACFSLLQIPSSASYNNLDDDMRKSLVLGVCNIINGPVPALPAALTLAALIRRRASLGRSAYGTSPGPALAGCAVDLGR